MEKLPPEEMQEIREILPPHTTLYFVRKSIYPCHRTGEIYAYARTYRVYIFPAPNEQPFEVTGLITKLYPELKQRKKPYLLKLIHTHAPDLTAQLAYDLHGDYNALNYRIL
jgi:hypothetical protein